MSIQTSCFQTFQNEKVILERKEINKVSPTPAYVLHQLMSYECPMERASRKCWEVKLKEPRRLR